MEIRKLNRRNKTEKPRSKPNQRYAKVFLTMTEEQKQELWSRANKLGLPMCELVRQILFGENYREVR